MLLPNKIIDKMIKSKKNSEWISKASINKSIMWKVAAPLLSSFLKYLGTGFLNNQEQKGFVVLILFLHLTDSGGFSVCLFSLFHISQLGVHYWICLQKKNFIKNPALMKCNQLQQFNSKWQIHNKRQYKKSQQNDALTLIKKLLF